MSNVTASYPIVDCMHISMNDCRFTDLTINGRYGGYISLFKDNSLGNVVLRNRGFLVTKGDITMSKLVIENELSFLCFSEGVFHIKELVGYKENVRMHINPGYNNYERQLIITDTDVSLWQFYVKNNISDDYTLGLGKNESGQNILSLVPKY